MIKTSAIVAVFSLPTFILVMVILSEVMTIKRSISSPINCHGEGMGERRGILIDKINGKNQIIIQCWGEDNK